MSLLRGLVAVVSLASLVTPALAHAPQRSLIGIHHFDGTTQPSDTWGTYCVTELAPFFRDAIAMNIKAGRSPTSGELLMAQPVSSTTPAVASDASTAASDVGTAPVVPPGGAPNATFAVGSAASPAGKIVVFTAEKIVTMDAGWPEATAVAVADGKIVSVGSLDDLKPWLDKYPYVVDDRFKDKVIYPGFVEAHGHPVMGSLAISRPSLSYFPMRNPYGGEIPGVRSREQAIARLKEYVGGAKTPDETVLTWGYDVVAMGGDFDRRELDAVSMTQPIIVWDASEHYAYANSAAIKKYGITNEMVAKTTGAETYPDGSSNGKFLGTNAARLILPPAISEIMVPEVALKNLKYLGDLMQQAGVTTTGDLFYGGVNLELERLLSEKFFGADDAMSRIVHVVDGYTFTELYGKDAIAKALDMKAHGNDREMFNGVKFYADDAFVSLGMKLLWPGYINADKYKGLFMYASKQAFIEAIRPWWDAGFAIHVHSNGSGGNQITLDALAALQDEKPRFDHRFAFEHFGISTTAQGRRVKALGAVVSTNPYYVYQRADLNIDQLGHRPCLTSRAHAFADRPGHCRVAPFRHTCRHSEPAPRSLGSGQPHRIRLRQGSRPGRTGRCGSRHENDHDRCSLHIGRGGQNRQYRDRQACRLRRPRRRSAGCRSHEDPRYRGRGDHSRRPRHPDVRDAAPLRAATRADEGSGGGIPPDQEPTQGRQIGKQSVSPTSSVRTAHFVV